MIYVMANDGVWCIASHKKTVRYADNVKVRCGHWITLPWGLVQETPRGPVCETCRAKVQGGTVCPSGSRIG